MSSPSLLGATAVQQRPTSPLISAAAPVNSLPNRLPHRRTASDALYPRPASPLGHHPLSSSTPKSNYHGPPTTTLSRLLAFFPTVASTRWRRRRVVIVVALFLAFLCLLTLPESSSNAASTMYRQQQQLLSNRRRLRPVDGGKRGAMVDPRWLRKQGDGIQANLLAKGKKDRRNNHKPAEGATAKEVNTVRPRPYVEPQPNTPRDTPDASQATLDSEDDDYSLDLTVPEELAALILFLASSSDNHLSVTTDPQAPLDPDAVLDVALPTRPDEADQRAEVLKQLRHDCWELWPTVVIGRRGQPATEKVKKLLRKEHYFGKKGTGLAYIETRGRPDEDVLVALLTRLTGLKTLPMILIGGHPVGSFAELNALHEAGDLGDELVEAGGGETIGHERRARLEFEGITEEEAQEEEREEAAAEAEKRSREKENA